MVKFPENLVRNRPIIVEDYNPDWPLLYEKEERNILAKLGSAALGIEHIGSTSVPGLAAKPIIDIIVRIANLTYARECIPLIESLNYRYLPEVEQVFSERIFFWKGTEDVHTVHLALMEQTSLHWNNLIAFRDYLKNHPQDAKRYEKLKRELAEKYVSNPNSYATGKEEFVALTLAKIKK
jgi:GrpB-like predicted nucleotidyltransferase (UPF0157 family)